MTTTTTAAKTTATHTVPDGTVYTRSTKKAPYLFAVEGLNVTGYYAGKWSAGFNTTEKAARKEAADMIARGMAYVRVIEL